MKAKLQKWGNSLAFRVPKGIAEEAGVATNDVVEIDVKEGAIVVQPIGKEYYLKDLVKGINKKNLHKEIDFGGPVGHEVW